MDSMRGIQLQAVLEARCNNYSDNDDDIDIDDSQDSNISHNRDDNDNRMI